jgi:RNA ligase
LNIDIEHIEDVLPHIIEGEGIIVSERPGYRVIDYVFATEDTFRSPLHLQCRGLKFDDTGRIIARPFHKFFNLGERELPEDVDWQRSHRVFEKLDGSMIHPAILAGEMAFMTRMGITDTARAAQAIASDAVLALCRAEIEAGRTPIFEYTGPDNRIIVPYDRPQLTLLTSRETVSGRYLGSADLDSLAQSFGVPVASGFGKVEDVASFISASRALREAEGYVIAFEDGHRLKIKANDYVLRHNALSTVQLEKNVLAAVVTETLDDILPLLDARTAELVRDYRRQVIRAIEGFVAEAEQFHAAHKDLPRKAYAEAALAKLPPHLQPAAFALLNNKPARDVAVVQLTKAAHSQNRIDQLRALYDLTWDPAHLSHIEPG